MNNHLRLSGASLKKIEKGTGCLKPCSYVTYKFVDHYTYEPNYTFGENGTHIEFMLSNTDIILRQESLLYSFNSFVAETGGILGT